MHSNLYIKIMNSARWREVRNRHMSEHPLCEECKAVGRITASRCVHHLVPVESGRDDEECWQLALNPSNLQALCFECHTEVHTRMKSYTKEKKRERTMQRFEQWRKRVEGMRGS